MRAMSGWRFGLALVVAAVGVTALLWWLGYWVIAFAVGVAVLVFGTVVYVAVRAGVRDSGTAGRRGHLQT